MNFNPLLHILQIFSVICLFSYAYFVFCHAKKCLVFTSCITESYPLWLLEHVSYSGRPSSPELYRYFSKFSSNIIIVLFLCLAL